MQRVGIDIVKPRPGTVEFLWHRVSQCVVRRITALGNNFESTPTVERLHPNDATPMNAAVSTSRKRTRVDVEVIAVVGATRVAHRALAHVAVTVPEPTLGRGAVTRRVVHTLPIRHAQLGRRAVTVSQAFHTTVGTGRG